MRLFPLGSGKKWSDFRHFILAPFLKGAKTPKIGYFNHNSHFKLEPMKRIEKLYLYVKTEIRLGSSFWNWCYMAKENKRIHTKKELSERRRELRQKMTAAEAFLWNHLKSRKLDGEVHQSPNAMEYDAKRTSYFEGLSYKVIRFENKMVFDNFQSVVMEIRDNFKNENLWKTLSSDTCLRRTKYQGEKGTGIRLRT